METAPVVLQVPNWLEYSLTGVLILMFLGIVLLALRGVVKKGSADASLDARNDAFAARLMKALDDSQAEKAEIVTRAQNKEAELYVRNKELNDRNAGMVDKILEMGRVHSTEMMTAVNQMRLEQDTRAREHKDSITRVHERLEVTTTALVRCEERDKVRAESEAEMMHRLAAMERIVGVKAAVGDTIVSR